MPFFFFFNDTATTEIYTLSLHDALPIWQPRRQICHLSVVRCHDQDISWFKGPLMALFVKPFHLRLERSEEHTSELQSQSNLVCRLLLEKKKRSLLRPLTDSACHTFAIK